MPSHRRSARQRGQWTLVGLLVSLVIIAILSSWYYARILKPQAGSHNAAPAAEQQAYGAVCSEYEAQLTQAVTMYKTDNNDRPPTNFEQLKKYGATDDLVRAPGCQFQLDPSTGAITEIGHGLAAPGAPPVVLGGGPPAPSAPPAPGAPLVLSSPSVRGTAPAPGSPAGSEQPAAGTRRDHAAAESEPAVRRGRRPVTVCPGLCSGGFLLCSKKS